MSLLRAVVAAIFAGAMVTGFLIPTSLAVAAPAAPHPGAVELTEIGEQAVLDLRRCLESRDRLDVLYLVDESSSLNPTDPGVLRADILANSLRELAGLRDGLTLSYAALGFHDGVEERVGWTEVDPLAVDTEVGRLFNSVPRAVGEGRGTNWLAGLQAAQVQLAARSDSCRTMIWLTDGGLWIEEYDEAADWQTLADLCGGVVNNYSPRGGYGLLNDFRRDGIVVFGVRLNTGVEDDRDDFAPYMQPLVEGTGYENTTCGEPLTDQHVHGAFLEATSADALAQVFLGLGIQLGGGFNRPFGQDGSFPVDLGVARFAILTSDPAWRLHSAAGAVIDAASSAAAGFEVERVGGTSRVRSMPIAPDDVGRWRLESTTGATDSLYYTSGLSVVLDPPNLFVAGADDNELRGRLVRNDGAVVDFTRGATWRYSLDLGDVTAEGVRAVQPDQVEGPTADGEFVVRYAAPGADGAMTLRATINALVTVESGVALSPVSAERVVDVVVPGQFPTIAPIQLSELLGSQGVADGTVRVEPAADGTSARICFADGGVPTITQDGAERSSSWRWTMPGVGVDGCLDVPPDQPVSLQLSARNEQAANGDVRARLAFVAHSADGAMLPGSVEVTFESKIQGNAGAFLLTLGLMILASVALPIGALYAFSWWTAKISRSGGSMQRASIPVRIGPEGEITLPDGAPLSSRTLQANKDLTYLPRGLPDARRVPVPGLGEAQARISPSPFGEPWFQVEPSSGTVLFGPPANIPRRLNAAAQRGALLGVPNDLGRIWGIAMSHRELLDSGSADPGVSRSRGNATLVLHLRPKTGKPEESLELLREIESNAYFRQRVVHARKLLSAEAVGGATAGGVGTASSGQPPGERHGGAPPPLRRAAGTDSPPPPPRQGGAGVPPSLPRRTPAGDSPPPLPGNRRNPPPLPPR